MSDLRELEPRIGWNAEEQPSEAIPMNIELNHSLSHRNDFFLLRAKISVNDSHVQIKADPNDGSSCLEHSESGLNGVRVSDLVPEVATLLSQKYGVCLTDAFCQKQVPLFSVVFPSKECLKKFLEKKEEVESNIAEALSTQFKTERDTTMRGSLDLPVPDGSSSGQDPMPLNVSVNADLLLASPAHSVEHVEYPASMYTVTLATFDHFADTWQHNELFDSDGGVLSNETQQDENAELKELQSELSGLCEWFEFGLEVDIPRDELLIIRTDNIQHGVKQCRLEMLITWEDHEKPTWKKVVGALVNIGRCGLAEVIAKKYGMKVPKPRVPSMASMSADEGVTEDSERQLLSKQQQLNKAKESRDFLNVNIQKEMTQLAQLQADNHILSGENEDLKIQLQHRNEEMAFLQASKKKRFAEAIERMKKQTEVQITNLQMALEQKSTELALAKRQLKGKEDELRAKVVEVEEKSVLVKSLYEEVEKLKQTFAEKQEEIYQQQKESYALSLSRERYLEEVKLQLEYAKSEVSIKDKAIGQHSQDIAIKDKQISQLSSSIKDHERKMTDLQQKLASHHSSSMQLMLENEQRLLSLQIESVHLKQELIKTEEEKLQRDFELRRAQESLRKYKSMIPDVTKCCAVLLDEQLEIDTVSHFQVSLFGEDGKPCSGSHKVEATVTLVNERSTAASITAKVSRDKPGEYLLSYTPTQAGPCEIQVTIDDTTLPSGPLRLHVHSCTELSVESEMEPMAMSLEAPVSYKLEAVPHKEFLAELQGIATKHYYSAMHPMAYRDNPGQENSFYVKCRDSIVNGTCPCTRKEAIRFAALQCQIQYGNHYTKPSFLNNLVEFLPKEYTELKGIEKSIFVEHRKLRNMSGIDARLKYIEICQSLKTYGATFFVVQEKVQDRRRKSHELVPCLLGITRESIMRVDQNTKEVLSTWPLSRIGRWEASPNSFTLGIQQDLGDYSTSFYSVQTIEGESICKEIACYVDSIVQKKQKSTAAASSRAKEISNGYILMRPWPINRVPNSAGDMSSGASLRAEEMSNGYMRPRPINRAPNYGHPPFGPPRPAPNLQGQSVILSPKQHRSAPLKIEPSKPGDGRHSYVNVQQTDLLPPPIDRSSKPSAPLIDRSNKPKQSSSGTGGVMKGEQEGKEKGVEDPVAFRGPVPVPMKRVRRVNYSDVDLHATSVLASQRQVSLGQAEIEHLQEKPYVNVDRDGVPDDTSDPDYYTHMRNLTL